MSNNGFSVDTGPPVSDIVLAVDNGYYAGSWRYKDTCPSGSYGGGIDLKVNTFFPNYHRGVDIHQYYKCKTDE